MRTAAHHRTRSTARHRKSHTATAARRCTPLRSFARATPPRARGNPRRERRRRRRPTGRGRPRALLSAACALMVTCRSTMTDQHVHTDSCNHSSILKDIAHQAMIDRGLQPDFPPAAEQQAESISAAANETDASIRDLRELLWCSIDNDDSRDLDQLTVAEDLGGGNGRAMVAVADVDALVKKGTPIDDHARQNTTSVYTAARIFPMLPEKLSTGLTSLNEHEERIALVIDMTLTSDGSVKESDVYRALVHNKAQLAYNAVAAWLDGGETPEKIAAVKGLAENLKMQDQIADKMRQLRHEHGALDLETIEARPVMKNGQVVDLQQEKRNNAR